MPVPAELPDIVDALYRFGAGQDRKDRALFDSAFAENSSLDFSQPAARFGVTLSAFQGRQAIGDSVFAALDGVTTTHTVTNPRATVSAAGAELFALVEAQHVRGGRHLLLKNSYQVWLGRSDEQWAIERLDITMVWHDGDPAVLFPG